jgi:hypothetical protein
LVFCFFEPSCAWFGEKGNQKGFDMGTYLDWKIWLDLFSSGDVQIKIMIRNVEPIGINLWKMIEEMEGSKKDFFTKIDQIEESDFEVGDHTRTKRRQPKIWKRNWKVFGKGKRLNLHLGNRLDLYWRSRIAKMGSNLKSEWIFWDHKKETKRREDLGDQNIEIWQTKSINVNCKSSKNRSNKSKIQKSINDINRHWIGSYLLLGSSQMELEVNKTKRFGKQNGSMWMQFNRDQTNQWSKNQSTTSIGIELDLIFFCDHHKWNWKWRKTKKRERFGRSVTLRDFAKSKYQCELQSIKIDQTNRGFNLQLFGLDGSYHLFWGSLQMEQDVNKNKREIKIIVEQSINQEIFLHIKEIEEMEGSKWIDYLHQIEKKNAKSFFFWKIPQYKRWNWKSMKIKKKSLILIIQSKNDLQITKKEWDLFLSNPK